MLQKLKHWAIYLMLISSGDRKKEKNKKTFSLHMTAMSAKMSLCWQKNKNKNDRKQFCTRKSSAARAYT
jgi:hypothetical protein